MEGDFWSIILVIAWAFVLAGYLFLLFHLLGDLFRDADLSGWWKAIWIILLIFIPYLTALVYIITRGRGMTEREVGSEPQWYRIRR